MTNTRQFCILTIFLLHHACAAENKTNSTNPQVPLLDIKQILEIGNLPHITSTEKDVNNATETPHSIINLLITRPTTTSTTSSSTNTSATPSTTIPTTPKTTVSSTASTTPTTTTTTTVRTTTSTTPKPTTSTVPTTITTSTIPTTTVSSTVPSSTKGIATSVASTEASISRSSPLAPANFLELFEIIPDVAPEPLRESTPVPSTTTTVATTTTPEPIRLGPMIEIGPGQLRPMVLRSRAGRRYYAFRGVPYAIPPVHFQRFKEPGPVAPWSDVLNASSYGPACIQYNILSGQIEGEEDCLTLNIFTNALPSGKNKKRGLEPYPVMVFFHQGAFMFGTSSDFEEKYMMDEPVVLVTVQYRLGAFGFLNTQGDSDARGNQGLKDQVLAMKFIRDNIHKFNGEPNSVTIFGESAGGASVHYHLLSDRSRGLFTRAISMSGTALSPWAFTRSPKRMAKKLGTLLNCPTSDMNELFTCLQGHEARVIAEKTKELYEWNTDPITPFAPSIEVEDSLSAFMTESPYNLMKSGRINDAAPWMLGVVENVCLLDTWSILVDKQLTDELNVDWHRIAPTTFLFKETALEPDAVSNQVRAYYFGTKDVGNDTYQELEHLYSDRYFNHGIRTSALMHVRTNEAIPVYLYLFSYKGTQSHTKFAGLSDIIGVSEGDDLRFLFNTNRFDDIPLNTTDGDISQKIVKLWVSFAKEGKPTAVWGDQKWDRISPAQIKGDEALMYYNLNEKSGFVEEPFLARMNFWDTLPLSENDNELLNFQNIHHQYLEMMTSLVGTTSFF